MAATRRSLLTACVAFTLTVGTFSGGVATVHADGPTVVAVTTTMPWLPAIGNSGPINSLMVQTDSTGERLVLAAAQNGGIFMTGDGGATWSHEYDFPATHPMDLAFVPSLHTILATATSDFESTNTGGLYERSESTTFTRVHGVIPAPSARCPQFAGAHGIAVDPVTAEIYVATDCGVAIGSLYTPFRTVDLSGYDPTMMDVITLGSGHLIAGGPAGVYYSADDGAHWARETTGIGGLSSEQGRMGLHALSPDPRGGGRAFAINAATQIYQTSDRGQTWTQIAAPTGGGSCGGIDNVHAVIEAGQEKLYFGDQCDTKVAILQQDGSWGAWTSLDVGHGDTRDIVFHSNGVPYLVSSDGGLSIRGGDDTHFILGPGPTHGLDADLVTEVAGQYVPGQTEPDLYFATQHNSVWSMVGSSSTVANGSGAGEGFFLGMPRIVAPSSHNKVTYVGCGACVNFIADPRFAAHAGWTGPEINVGSPKFLAPYDYVQAVDNNNGFTAGLQYTNNDGAPGSWRQIADIPYSLFGLPQVAGSPGNPILTQPVRVGDRSDGIAQVWVARITNFSSGMPGIVGYPPMASFGSLGVSPTEFAWYEVLGVDPSDPSYMIAPDVFNGDIRYTHTGGATWSTVPGNLSSLVTQGGHYRFSVPVANRLMPNVSVVSFCPENDSRILVGTHQGGAFFSFDGGNTWTAVSHSDSVTYATSVFWTAGCGAAYMSTYGRGIWKITMTLTTQNMNPRHPCTNVVFCNLYARFKPQPIPKGDPALVISDGWITSIQQSGGHSTVHITEGSVVTNWIKSPQNVKVVVDRGALAASGQAAFTGATASSSARGSTRVSRAKGRYTFVAFFKNGKLVRTDTSSTEVRLYPLKQGTLGKVWSKPSVTPQGVISIQGSATINGNETAMVETNAPLNIIGIPSQPYSSPIVMSIDGQVVAKADANSKVITYYEKAQQWGQGMHAVQLVAETQKGPQCFATGQFLVPNGDKGGRMTG